MTRNYLLKAVVGIAFSGLTAFNAHARALDVRLAQSLAPMSGLVFVAKQKGFFEQHGLDVAISNFTSGKQSLDTVIGGGADIATAAEAPITAAAMARQQIAIVAKMESAGLKTLASAASGIRKTGDLKGKKVAFTAGTGGEVYTMRLLKSAGLVASDVTLVNLRPQDMVAALASGSIDAYGTWEPHIYNGTKALGAKVVPLDTKGIYAETFNIVVMQDYLQKKPAAVKLFLKSLVEAEAWIKANPDEAIKVVADFVKMPINDLKPIWADYIYQVALDGQVLDVLNAHAAWRLESGNHPPGATMPDWRKFIFSAPLKSLAPERVTIPE